MKTTTINYIHSLLTECAATKKKEYRASLDACDKAKKDINKDVSDFSDVCDKALKSYAEAKEVLQDFEKHNW